MIKASDVPIADRLGRGSEGHRIGGGLWQQISFEAATNSAVKASSISVHGEQMIVLQVR